MPTIVIMQAVPGSGKSFHARRIVEETGAVIVSNDHFPGLYSTGPDGKPKIDLALRGKAFGVTFRQAIEHVQAGRSIIVDNTNTTEAEIAPFILLAQAYGATSRIIRVRCNPLKAWKRNTHGVPWEAFEVLCKRLDAFKAPPHWPAVETIDN